MHVEHVHKHADFQRGHFAERIFGAFHHHNAPVGRAEHGFRIGRDIARRIAEKLHRKHGEHPKRQRPPAAAEAHQHAQQQPAQNKRPAFPRNQRVGVETVHGMILLKLSWNRARLYKIRGRAEAACVKSMRLPESMSFNEVKTAPSAFSGSLIGFPHHCSPRSPVRSPQVSSCS